MSWQKKEKGIGEVWGKRKGIVYTKILWYSGGYVIWYVSFPLASECLSVILCPFLIIPSSFPGPYFNGIYFLLMLFYNLIYPSLLNLNFLEQIKFHLNYHLLFLAGFGLWYYFIVFSSLVLLHWCFHWCHDWEYAFEGALGQGLWSFRWIKKINGTLRVTCLHTQQVQAAAQALMDKLQQC